MNEGAPAFMLIKGWFEGYMEGFNSGMVEGTIRAVKAESWALDQLERVPENPDDDPVVQMLWDYLRRDAEHKDRRCTGVGTKTKLGLAATVRALVVGGKK
jgi:hypothetical protein